jgi:hypothetical protein
MFFVDRHFIFFYKRALIKTQEFLKIHLFVYFLRPFFLEIVSIIFINYIEKMFAKKANLNKLCFKFILVGYQNP